MGLVDWLRGYKSPNTRVHMVVSIGEYVAGESYDIPVELADEYIIKNYARGSLSRAYSQDEQETVTRMDQKVGV